MIFTHWKFRIHSCIILGSGCRRTDSVQLSGRPNTSKGISTSDHRFEISLTRWPRFEAAVIRLFQIPAKIYDTNSYQLMHKIFPMNHLRRCNCRHLSEDFTLIQQLINDYCTWWFQEWKVTNVHHLRDQRITAKRSTPLRFSFGVNYCNVLKASILGMMFWAARWKRQGRSRSFSTLSKSAHFLIKSPCASWWINYSLHGSLPKKIQIAQK